MKIVFFPNTDALFVLTKQLLDIQFLKKAAAVELNVLFHWIFYVVGEWNCFLPHFSTYNETSVGSLLNSTGKIVSEFF